nr:site-specific integrase [Methylobacterium sp. OTU13CASTA1]
MARSRVAPEAECRISGCEWTSGKYGIKKNGGKNWYLWFYSPETGENDRTSLRTPIFSVATKRAEDIIAGIDPRYPGGDPIVYDIVKEHVDTYPAEHHRHRIWRMLEPTLKELASDLKVSRLGMDDVQYSIIEHIIARGYVSSTTHQMMAGISAAITWAATAECAPGVKRSKHRPQILMNQDKICKKFGISKQKPDNWHPNRDGMVQLINALREHPAVLRWLLVMLTFGCRVEAAAETTGAQLEWSQYKLNPDCRPEYENKRRPELPVAWSSLAEFRTWGDGPWIGLTSEEIYDVFFKVRKKLNLPKLKPSSIRDYTCTMLRHAHVTHGVRYVPEEQIKMWQGHMKVDDIHQNYGEFRPEYHLRCRIATEAALRDLDHRTGGAFFRQGSDKTPLKDLASLEQVEGISGFLEVNDHTELPQETTIYLGPKQDKTGGNGPIKGTFRQASDKKVRHPDGTIDALGTFGRLPLEQRLAADGFTIMESVPEICNNGPSATYIVATGSNQIPAARAGDLSTFYNSTELLTNGLNHYATPTETGQQYKDDLRIFEVEMTQIFDGCEDENERFCLDDKFFRDLFFIVFPVITGLPEPKKVLDFGSMSYEEREEYISGRLKVA